MIRDCSGAESGALSARVAGEGALPIVLAGYLLSLLCGIHVVRTGRELYWIVIFVIAPGLGPLVYLVAIVLPNEFNPARRRKAATAARKVVDPDGPLREAMNQAELSP